MGRSQRHMLWEQSTTAAGEIHAQGVVAPGIAMQVDPSALNVLKAGPPLFNTGKPLTEDDAGGVEVPIGEPGGPLTGSSLTGAIPDLLDDGMPTLTSLDPASSPIQSGDVTVTITGTGFVETTTLVWNGADDTCAFVSDTELTTIVKTDLSTIPVPCTVAVRNGNLVSNELTFELLEAEPVEEAGRLYPIGPLGIASVTDHDLGLVIGLAEAADVREGDLVTIEATGNTSVNGSYTVLTIDPIVVDNQYVLETSIEGKGRLTVISGA